MPSELAPLQPQTSPPSLLPTPARDAALRRRRDQAATETLAQIRALAEDPETPEVVRRMTDYIAEYLFDPALDADGILASARRGDLDPGNVALTFSEHAGAPPMRFVDASRYAVAQPLLDRPDLPIARAVALAGFPSVESFWRAATWTSTADPRRRELIGTHRAAARRAGTDTDRVLDRLADELSGPDLHALTAKLLERLSVDEKTEASS